LNYIIGDWIEEIDTERLSDNDTVIFFHWYDGDKMEMKRVKKYCRDNYIKYDTIYVMPFVEEIESGVVMKIVQSYHPNMEVMMWE
jgi:hypothetical protein